MSFKRAKVVMLPSLKKKAPLSLRAIGDKLLFAKDYLLDYFDADINHNPQHLYIISDDKINIGDWVTNGVTVWKFVAELKTINYKKIIASTEPLLKSDWVYKNNILPSPSDSFITKFAESYNEGRTPKTNWLPITDILVEYESITVSSGHSKKELNDNASFEERLKVDRKTNTITIKKFKQMFSREELDKILLDVMNLGMSLRQNQLSGHDQRSGNEVLDIYKNDNL